MIWKEFAGPVAQDDEVHLSLGLDSVFRFLVGRISNHGGTPLGGRRFNLNYGVERNGTTLHVGTNFLTDDEGRFRIHVPHSQIEGLVTMPWLTIDRGNRNTEAVPWFVEVGSRPLATGDNDLGELVVARAPVIATGRVLVNGEAPEAGRAINLRVERLEYTGTGSTRRETWRSAQGYHLSREEDGRFAVWGLDRAPRYQLTTLSSGYLPYETVEFVSGTEGLELRLQTGGSLEAVVGHEGARSDLGASLVPTSGPALQVTMALAGVEEGTRRRHESLLTGRSRRGAPGEVPFRWQVLLPGQYRLEIRTRGGVGPAIAVPGIEVRTDEVTKLDPIDPEGRIRRIRVGVVDVRGRPIVAPEADPAVVILERGADELQGFELQQGAAEIPVGEPVVDLLVVARGYQPKEVLGVNSSRTVVLEPYPNVDMQLAGGLPDLPEGIGLTVQLRPKDRTPDGRAFRRESGGENLAPYFEVPSSSIEFGPDGRFVCPVAQDGVHEVRVVVRDQTTRRSNTVLALPTEIDVRLAEDLVYEFTIPPRSLEAAVRWVRNR